MNPIYNTIGTNYNVTRQADAYLTACILKFLQPVTDKHYLDIGCGTGNYTIALANNGLNFTGVEPAEKMLDEASQKNQTISWLKGSAEQIPVGDNIHNGVIATLTIHHWNDLYKSFTEIYRITAVGGKLIVFTTTPSQMRGYWLNHYFPQMLESSIKQMLDLSEVEEAITGAGFKMVTTEKYFVRPDLQDHFLYSGKHRPGIYFNSDIRNGISSFAALANTAEVKTGLGNLHKDIESGKFEEIKERYENDEGDYLFIVAEK